MNTRTKIIAVTGMLGALSSVLMLFELPIPLVPSFIKMDFSELPIIIAGFLYGPLYGSAAALIKILLHLVMKGTSTGGVGELANLAGSLAYMLPAALIYQHRKSRSAAILGLAVGTVITSIVMVLLNTYVTFPLYIRVFGMTEEVIIGMGHAVNPLVNDMLTMMLCSVLPFNLFKYGVVSLITVLVYKRLSVILK